MDYTTRAQAREDIIALKLPQIILDAFDAKPLLYNLDIQFREPYPIFALDQEEQASYGTGRITPIWTGGGDYIIVGYHHDLARRGFFRFDIESPGEESQPIGLSWQQILVKEFKFLWEDGWTTEQLREVAGWFEFKIADLLIGELEKKEGTFEDDEAWYRAFLEKVGALSDD